MNLRDSFLHLHREIAAMELRTGSRRDDGLSYRDLTFVNLIISMEGCTVIKLADIMGISKPAVTMRVNRLMELGLVAKERSAEDERVNILTPTPEARARYGEIDRRVDSALSKLDGEYTPEDVERMSEMMDRLAELLGESDRT